MISAQPNTDAARQVLISDHSTIEAGTTVEVLHTYTAAGIEWCRCALVDGAVRRVVSIPASKLTALGAGR